MTTPDRSRLQMNSWMAVVRTYQECTRRYAQLLNGFDLTIPQFDVLNAVIQLGDAATPKAIADQLVVTRGNITGVLHRLQDHGLLVTRTHEYDGRSFVCALTHAGHARLNQARRAAAAFIAEQLAPFDDDALKTTENHMNRMRAHLLTIDPDAIVARVQATPPPTSTEPSRR